MAGSPGTGLGSRERWRRWSTTPGPIVVVALAIAAAGAVAYLVTRSSPPSLYVEPRTAPPPGVHAPVPGEGLVQYTGGWRPAAAYRAFSYLLVSASDASRAAREPGRSLVYFSGTDVNRVWSTGVPFGEASSHGWLLRDARGRLLVNRGYPGNAVADVGNAAYQQAWVHNVLAFLQRHHDSGVFIDDVLSDLRSLAGSEAARYPTQQDWAAAQLSFVRVAGSALRAHGYYVLVNASGYVAGQVASDDGGNTLSWWQRLAPYVSGLLDEYYQETSNGEDAARSIGTAWYQNWSGWQRLVRAAQALGKDFVGLSYGRPGDVRQMMYGKASFLLQWNGRGGAYIYDANQTTAIPKLSWTPAVGSPVGSSRKVGNGWLRRYTTGIALVNPDPASSQRFRLGGSYRLPDGRRVTSVTLAPTSGLVLASAGPGAAAVTDSTRRS